MRRLFRAALTALLLALPAVGAGAAPASATHQNQCNDGGGLEVPLVHVENVTILGEPVGNLYLALDISANPPAVTGFWLCMDTPLGPQNLRVAVGDSHPAMIQQTVEICLSSGACGYILEPTGVGAMLPLIVIAPDGTITVDPTTARLCVYVDGAPTCVL